MTVLRNIPAGEPWPTQRTLTRGKRTRNDTLFTDAEFDAAEWEHLQDWVRGDAPVWHPAGDGAY